MAISIKTEQEIESMRRGGRILAEVLEETIKRALPGVSTYELDQFAEEYIRSKGGKPGFKGYQGFPATLCTAINEVIVHGIPRKDEILQDGDIFTADCGVLLDGLYTDAARSVAVGTANKEIERLIKTAYLALDKGIEAAKPGARIGDISKAIEKVVHEAGFKVIHDLTGHGIGRNLHESPTILNYWDGNEGTIIKPGMTLAIEPIFSVGTSEMITLKDNWTIATDDGSCSVQAENTILITKDGNEILTQL